MIEGKIYGGYQFTSDKIGYITSTNEPKVNFNRSVLLLIEEEEAHAVETIPRSD